MTTYKIDNNYSIASNSYNKNAKLIDTISRRALDIEDKVSIGRKEHLDSTKVTNQLSTPRIDIILKGDQLITEKQTNFSTILQEKFKKIIKTETLSSRDIETETNLVELAATVNEAEIQLQQVVHVRDKFVAAFKEILNSAF